MKGDGHRQGGIAREIHSHGILQSEHTRLEKASLKNFRDGYRRRLQRRQSDEVNLRKNLPQGILPLCPPAQGLSIPRSVANATNEEGHLGSGCHTQSVTETLVTDPDAGGGDGIAVIFCLFPLLSESSSRGTT
jgi:hypothetical protein